MNMPKFEFKLTPNYMQQVRHAELAMERMVQEILDQNPGAKLVGDEIIIERKANECNN